MARTSRARELATAAGWFGVVTQVLLVLVSILNIFSVAVTVAALHRGLRVLRKRADGAMQRFVVALVTGAVPMALSLFAGATGWFLFGLVSWLSILLAWLVTQRVVEEQRRDFALRHRFAAAPARDDSEEGPSPRPGSR